MKEINPEILAKMQKLAVDESESLADIMESTLKRHGPEALLFLKTVLAVHSTNRMLEGFCDHAIALVDASELPAEFKVQLKQHRMMVMEIVSNVFSGYQMQAQQTVPPEQIDDVNKCAKSALDRIMAFYTKEEKLTVEGLKDIE